MRIQKMGNWHSSCGKISHLSDVKGKDKEDDPVLGEDLDFGDGELMELGCELGIVEGQLCSIPYELYDLPDLRAILSLETWNSCLTEEERFYLSAYLPDMDQQTFWLTMKELFDGSNIYFGSPLDNFFKRLKGGSFPPKVTCVREGLQLLQRRKYYHSLRAYHNRMAQKFIDMRRIWNQCDVSTGIDEKISMWRKRRKQSGIRLLDLNKFPKDNSLLSDEYISEAKVMELVTSKRPNDILMPSVNSVEFVAPNCRGKGVLKVRASGSGSFQNHNSKTVPGENLERCPSVPKGVLKRVPRVPNARLEQSEVLPRGKQPTILTGNQDCPDLKFSALATSLSFRDADGLYKLPFLRQNIDSNRVRATLNQPPCLLNQQMTSMGISNHSERSIRISKKENLSSIADISVLGKHKLFEGDVGRGPSKEYVSSINQVGAMRYPFGGENPWPNLGTATKDHRLGSLDPYPLGIQTHGGVHHMSLMKDEHIATYPRFPEVVPGISDVGNGKQETLIASSDGMTDKSDVNARKSEKLLRKSTVPDGIKVKMLPLTYKRRKSLSKANSLDLGKPLTAEADCKSAMLDESSQHLGDGAKALKIRFTGWKDMPFNEEPKRNLTD